MGSFMTDLVNHAPGFFSLELFTTDIFDIKDIKDEEGLVAHISAGRHNPLYNNQNFDSESLKNRTNDKRA
ncbi:hypothetical protein MNBD_NITROSPINAE02-1650 [hydrothermal vent metagenome]|uniref:Uncharacterized protein n=1 Tax=hydrothermal vent metagenome TaxID=652676 RepID=A0A3B1CHC8_9ZZZZ